MIQNDEPQVAEEVPEGPDAEETTGALINIETINLPELLNTGAGVETILAEVRRLTADIVPDLTTDKGRKAIASLAYRVSRTKTILDEARLEYTKGMRERLANINANGQLLIKGLEKIRDDVKAPLDQWKEEEERRQLAILEEARREQEAREAAERFAAEVQTRIATWANMPAVVVGMSVAEVEATLERYEAMELSPDLFGDRLEEAREVRRASLLKVAGYLDLQRKVEALEQQEAAAQAAREAAEQAERDREAAEIRAAIERNERIDLRIRQFRHDAMMEARGRPAKDLDEMVGVIERHTFEATDYGDRLGEAYTVRTAVAEELRAMRDAAHEAEQAAAEREARRQQAEAERRAQQRRDEVQGRIQGLQTKVLTEAVGRGLEALEALRYAFHDMDLDPADFDDQWDAALASKATALAKLDAMIAEARQAEADRAEAAELRRQAEERAAREAQEQAAAAERAKQAANKRHQEGVRARAVGALCQHTGLSEADAKKVVDSVEEGLIPAVTLTF